MPVRGIHGGGAEVSESRLVRVWVRDSMPEVTLLMLSDEAAELPESLYGVEWWSYAAPPTVAELEAFHER